MIPPSKFSLKNSAVLFTPEGAGYRIAASDIGFEDDFGSRFVSFLGIDGKPINDADNGYRDISIAGAQFSFFGTSYDTLYVGTNGYITFTQGDTTSRLSPSALATELPRIAPLWADLDFTDSGGIYYNRLGSRHLAAFVQRHKQVPSGAVRRWTNRFRLRKSKSTGSVGGYFARPFDCGPARSRLLEPAELECGRPVLRNIREREALGSSCLASCILQLASRQL